MIERLISKERERVARLAKDAADHQRQARAYVIGPMDEDEDEEASSAGAMAYDQRMKAQAYEYARRATEEWLVADADLRYAVEGAR